MVTLISVLICSYNSAQTLERALESALDQNFSSDEYEVLLIDDGSTDNTEEVFAEFKNNTNWKFIRFKENKGYPYCKNFAFEKLSGAYITFLDSDDLWLSNRLEEFYKHLSKYPEHGFVFSNGYVLQDGIIAKMFDEKRDIPDGKIPSYMAISDMWLPYVTTNVALRKEVVINTGKYNEKMTYLGDTEYFVRILKQTMCGCIKEPLSVYRIHPVSLTQSRDECIEESIQSLNISEPFPNEGSIFLS